MPTRRGWATLGLGLALVGGGRVLGALELFVLGTGAVAVVALGVASVRLTALDLAVDRVVRPRRLHAGGTGSVVLVLTNPGARPSPPVTGRERLLVAGTDPGTGALARSVSFQLGPLTPGRGETVSYRVAVPRGLYRAGPLEVAAADPWGMARRSRSAGGTATITVYPRVEPVPVPPGSGGPRSGRDGRRAATPGGGQDFAALRPYEVGDDLRRVHWPSTARQDDLVVRHTEQPRQGRTTVLCDLRARAHPDPAAFERTLSLAASVACACLEGPGGGRSVRLVTTDGYDSGPGDGRAHAEAILTHLALATPTAHDLAPVAAEVLGAEAPLVLTTEAGAAHLVAAGATELPPLGPLVLATATGPAGGGRGEAGAVRVPVDGDMATALARAFGVARRAGTR